MLLTFLRAAERFASVFSLSDRAPQVAIAIFPFRMATFQLKAVSQASRATPVATAICATGHSWCPSQNIAVLFTKVKLLVGF